jgi:transposase
MHGLARRSFCNWCKRFKADDAAAERVLIRRRGCRPRPSVCPSADHSPIAPKELPYGVLRAHRRRQFPDELKRQIVMETMAPGATVSAVAREYGVTPPCVFRWRKLMGLGASNERVRFASVRISDEKSSAGDSPNRASQLAFPPPAAPADHSPEGVEVELSGGKRLRFARDIDPETVRRMIEIVEGAHP